LNQTQICSRITISTKLNKTSCQGVANAKRETQVQILDLLQT